MPKNNSASVGEVFVNVELQPKPIYDNPPGDGDDAEKFPILADGSCENPVYTSEDFIDVSKRNKTSQKSGTTVDDDRYDIPYKRPKLRTSHLFSVTVCLIEIVGIIVVIATTCWVVYYRGGVGWDSRTREFNAHPVFMVVGLVFFYSNAALTSYALRTETNNHPSLLRLLHLLSVTVTFIMTIVGFVAGIEMKRTFYSFHSWIGLMTLSMFSMQVVIGFLAIFPKCEDVTRKKYLKFQIWIFFCVFILSLIACVTGISNYLTLEKVSSITSFSNEGLVTNILKVLLLIFGVMTSSVLCHPVYRQA